MHRNDRWIIRRFYEKNMQYLGDFAARFDQHFSKKDHTVHSDYTGRIEGDKFCIYKCGNIIVKNTFCTVLRGTYEELNEELAKLPS